MSFDDASVETAPAPGVLAVANGDAFIFLADFCSWASVTISKVSPVQPHLLCPLLIPVKFHFTTVPERRFLPTCCSAVRLLAVGR